MVMKIWEYCKTKEAISLTTHACTHQSCQTTLYEEDRAATYLECGSKNII